MKKKFQKGFFYFHTIFIKKFVLTKFKFIKVYYFSIMNYKFVDIYFTKNIKCIVGHILDYLELFSKQIILIYGFVKDQNKYKKNV